MVNPDKLLLSLREFKENDPDKRWCGVISSGGHPVLDPDTQCTVHDAKYFSNDADALIWFEQQSISRPWEQRH